MFYNYSFLSYIFICYKKESTNKKKLCLYCFVNLFLGNFYYKFNFIFCF